MPRRIERDPDMLRKRLDAAGAKAYLESIARGAQGVEIRTRSHRAANSQASAAQIEEIADQLLAGVIEAVQLRFVRDGELWCDTLMRVGDSYRLVSMPQGPDATSPTKGDETCQRQRRV